MARFFLAGSNIFGGVAYIRGDDLEHMRVLRIKNGELFTVCDGNGTDYTCRIKSSEDDVIEAEIVSSSPSVSEPDVKVSVYAAYSKGDKAETVIQKAVELGAWEIVLFPSARCVARYDDKALAKKLIRWQRISQEAAKQSGRGVIPVVKALTSYSQAVTMAAKADVPIFLYEEEDTLGLRQVLESRQDAGTVAIMTGPEGGFEKEEAEAAQRAGMLSTTLGKRILRCETAPLCALSAVMLFTNNL